MTKPQIEQEARKRVEEYKEYVKEYLCVKRPTPKSKATKLTIEKTCKYAKKCALTAIDREIALAFVYNVMLRLAISSLKRAGHDVEHFEKELLRHDDLTQIRKAIEEL
jgi:hypothetical protein